MLNHHHNHYPRQNCLPSYWKSQENGREHFCRLFVPGAAVTTVLGFIQPVRKHHVCCSGFKTCYSCCYAGGCFENTVFIIIVLVAFVFFLFPRPSSDDRNCQNTKCATLQAVNAYCLMLLAIPSMFLLVQQVTCNSNDGFWWLEDYHAMSLFSCGQRSLQEFWHLAAGSYFFHILIKFVVSNQYFAGILFHINRSIGLWGAAFLCWISDRCFIWMNTKMLIIILMMLIYISSRFFCEFWAGLGFPYLHGAWCLIFKIIITNIMIAFFQSTLSPQNVPNSGMFLFSWPLTRLLSSLPTSTWSSTDHGLFQI